MYKIVVVEDEMFLRKGLITTTDWAKHGAEIIAEFESSKKALEQIPQLKPDIVISDIRMPGLSGLEMIECLQRNEMDCSYIIISGFDDFSYAKQSIEIGVIGYLLKPIDDQELDETLAKAIQSLEDARDLRRFKKISASMSSRENSSLSDYFRLFEQQKQGLLQDKYLEQAFDIIRQQYRNNLTVKSIAEAMKMSESYIFKLFKNKTGYTVLEWITYYRMKQALQLMQESDLKIYEIAERVGYRDVRYFSAVFKKHLGFTPSVYSHVK